jgi:hypothetical protein
MYFKNIKKDQIQLKDKSFFFFFFLFFKKVFFFHVDFIYLIKNYRRKETNYNLEKNIYIIRIYM